jgi:competence protein ComEA
MLRLTRREQVVLIGFLVLIMIASGIYMYGRPSMATELPLPKLADSTGQTAASKPIPEVTVDVKGAVHAPGVFTLPGSSRVVEAIQAAGGATEQADLESLNLAQKLLDGSSIVVPLKGQAGGTANGSSSASGSAGGAYSSAQSGKININQATAEQLDGLEGIGSTRAKAIVQYREQNGPFQSVDDLLQVKGIGPKLLEAIRDRITVY